ncbi:MAG: thiol:disulfide interchange protein [Myxococcota bacterium]
MVLTEDERQQFVAEFLTELEHEHELREESANDVQAKKGSRRTEAFKREEEEAEIRNSLRRKFYEENGYKQTTDRTGRQVWLSPSQYAIKSKARKKKKRKKTRIKPKNQAGPREILLFLLMCASAVVIGLMLVR